MRAEDRFVERLRAMLPRADEVLLGIGDDAAVLRAGGRDLVATTDLLVEGVDFLPGEDPERLGRRAVSVSLSDIAAMGARPAWFLLSIALPAPVDEDLALALCRGAAARGREHGAALVGGDLSRGPAIFLSVAMTGEVESESRPLTRSGARPGDGLYLSGATGRAAAGLALAKGVTGEGLAPTDRDELLAAYRDPEPRVALGRALARGGLAGAAIDVSDGLGIDAARLARASGVRAVIARNLLPISPALSAFCADGRASALDLALGGGDDYELLFAAGPDAEDALQNAAAGAAVTRIGFFEEGAGAVLRDAAGDRDVAQLGYDHFGATT